MNSTFIKKACGQISDKAQRNLVAAELEAHISDKADYYRELGYDEETSLDKAIEDMGDPEEISAPLNALHKSNSVICVILTVVLVLLYFAVHFYHGRMNYGAKYEILVYHSVVMDFLSSAFIGAAAAILLISYRKKKKIFALIVSAVLVISLIHSFGELSEHNNSLLYIFQPASYAAAKIFTSGFDGYICSIFAYNSVQGGIPEQYYHIIGVIIFVILMLWSTAQYIILRRLERMENARKASRILKISGRAFSLILAANTAVMIFCTTAAAINLPQSLEAAKDERVKLIDEVIDADLDDAPPQSWPKSYQKIKGGKLPEDYYYNGYDSNFFMDIYGDENYSGNYSNSLLTYKKTVKRTFLSFRIRSSDAWTSVDKGNLKLNEGDHMLSSPYAAGDTLSDCREYSKAFYNYTISVMHYRFTGSNGKAEEHIQFWFQTKDGPKPYTFIKRGDGEFYLTDYFIMFRDELKTNNNK